jgi:FlaA1/EpsC-like NDP-sugar epimerase
MILDMIEKDQKITQRKMSEILGSAVSMINTYLDEYENNGYITREYLSTKTVLYHITAAGFERKKLLNIWYLQASQIVYQSAKNNIINYLMEISKRGFHKIMLYGAGEVTSIILDVIQDDKLVPLTVVAIVDDDLDKVNHTISGLKVISINSLNEFIFDGILISSYAHSGKMYTKLLSVNYPRDNILKFFD